MHPDRFDDEYDVADHAVDHLIHRLRRSVSWAIEGCLVKIFVMVLLLGFIGFVAYQVAFSQEGAAFWEGARTIKESMPGQQRPVERVTWDGATPYTCSGSQVVEVAGATATFDQGRAISASGSCQLTLVDVTVTAPTALHVSGNAQVTLRGETSLEGAEHVIDAAGNAVIVDEGVALDGPRKIGPNAVVRAAP